MTRSEKAIKIEPCPFCGANAKLHPKIVDTMTITHKLNCFETVQNSAGDDVVTIQYIFLWETEKLKAWNTRYILECYKKQRPAV